MIAMNSNIYRISCLILLSSLLVQGFIQSSNVILKSRTCHKIDYQQVHASRINTYTPNQPIIKKPTLFERFKVKHVLSSFIIYLTLTLKKAVASTVPAVEATKSKFGPLQGAAIWGLLFILSASLQSADTAITKISPWKVQEYVDEEGPDSPFATLSTKMTTLLSTILVTTTACSIYSTALFVEVVSEIFPNLSLGIVTALLTIVTLFLGELLPKALAVSNSELVARKMVPIINRFSFFLLPITSALTSLSDWVLKFAGMKSKEETNVTEDMLRLVVSEAEQSESIHSDEGRMIKAVLDMQDTDVSRIMQPRVDIVALPEEASAAEILEAALGTRYSRIPVYKGDVDNIVGVVFSKDLLTHMSEPGFTTIRQEFNITTTTTAAAAAAAAVETTTTTDAHTNNNNNTTSTARVCQQTENWRSLTAAQLMQPTYFIPETMKAWNALQEMRRRRIHMAIVVDEYGGTSGLVTFEDILEEVVGEIYDEDDSEEEADDSKTIYRNHDGSYTIRGYAELDDVCEALNIAIDEETKGETSTIGGLLCALAGEIPKDGDHLYFNGYDFLVVQVEDGRRIIKLLVRRNEFQVADSSSSSSSKNDNGDNMNADRYASAGSATNGADNIAMTE